MIWLKFIAALLFAIAVILALGVGTFKYDGALIPGGLLAWVLSELPNPSTYWPRRS